MTNTTKSIIDIVIVFTMSLVAFLLEDFVNTKGWIDIGEEARGVSAVVCGALTAVALVFARGGNFGELGFKRPSRWRTLFLQALIVLIVFAVAQNLAPLLVSLFIDLPEPDWSRYDSISGNLGAAISLALILPFTASIPEEIIYRGFLMGRLSTIFSQDNRGAIITVLIQALIFGLIHFAWGIGGMLMTFIMGVIWGTAYILCERNLWVVIFAHSGGHVLFVVSLYLGAFNSG